MITMSSTRKDKWQMAANKSVFFKSNGSKKQLSIPDLFSSKVLTGAEVTTAQVCIAPESRDSSQNSCCSKPTAPRLCCDTSNLHLFQFFLFMATF